MTERLGRLPSQRQLPWYIELVDERPHELQPAAGVRATTDDGLTRCELLALAWAANGLTARETSRRIFKSSETIKAQLSTARLKLGARNTTHAVSIALQKHLLTESDASGEAAA